MKLWLAARACSLLLPNRANSTIWFCVCNLNMLCHMNSLFSSWNKRSGLIALLTQSVCIGAGHWG